MADEPTPITVSANAPTLDTLKALGRYVVVIVTLFPAIVAVLKTKDIGAIVAFIHGQDFASLVSAVIGIGTVGYGLWRTFHRTNQVATVAANPAVPESVATIK